MCRIDNYWYQGGGGRMGVEGWVMGVGLSLHLSCFTS